MFCADNWAPQATSYRALLSTCCVRPSPRRCVRSRRRRRRVVRPCPRRRRVRPCPCLGRPCRGRLHPCRRRATPILRQPLGPWRLAVPLPHQISLDTPSQNPPSTTLFLTSTPPLFPAAWVSPDLTAVYGAFFWSFLGEDLIDKLLRNCYISWKSKYNFPGLQVAIDVFAPSLAMDRCYISVHFFGD